LKNQSGTVAARVGQKIASEIEGSGVDNPYANIPVPSCAGLSAAACVELLEELGLTPSVAYLGWGSAVLGDVDLENPVETLEAQAEKVQELSPEVGTKLAAGAEVEVTANPKLADMPLIVPESPAPGDSVSEFEGKLGAMGEWGTVTNEVLGEATLDPAYDPSTVVRPVPEAGTRLDPASEPDLTVQTNPATAPPAAAPGSWTPPGIDAVELPSFEGSFCGSFPFGLFCWYGEALTDWGAEGTCPEAEIPLGQTVAPEGSEKIDFCAMEPALEIVRPILVLLGTISLVMFVASKAVGGGGTGMEP